ncbi:PQQ-dependent dehydrogenase, methanol/ethanol family [Steroidobacter sp. S1-65]|uniref:PQQ-dependent dehydrogenase, methanol/ethanol family n=1 Tax=Steroidobacter gossypii TaxID=2805490 RepID=A0ABS1X6R5_9GAMM|nr:PQQ-dependent dehydrogenase, methanol/ethanol family [Steroidobacter gossypii]MBM0108914.1 PQQ-dependent dehydrogenase, methanol/ethanol family [Steroidobacter gossypii]
MKSVAGASVAIAWSATLSLCVLPDVGGAVDDRPSAGEVGIQDWPEPGRTFAEQHYSPLSSINRGNVAQLGLAWHLDLPGERSLHATPLAIGGVLYFSGTNGTTYAVDVRSGKQLWRFDPELATHTPDRKGILFGSHRGVAYWGGNIYVGTVDGRLLALNAKTGHPVWSIQTFDEADASKQISGAPRVAGGKVIIGHGGEGGTRGYVTAYDAVRGARLWRFYTVPGNPAKGFENAAMEMAAKTWRGEWWKDGGNATVWDNIAYDPELKLVYIGTANGTPINASRRGAGGGDNLFVASIIALDLHTGEYRWHYQVNPGESWDYDATQQTVLAELDIGGQQRKVLMLASKNGFFYVIDRLTGKLISAEKFSKANWAQRIDLKSGRPIETRAARYGSEPVPIWPSVVGAHSWQRMSFSPRTGLVYIPTIQLGMMIGAKSIDVRPIESGDGVGTLLAWDPIAQKSHWEVRYIDCSWNGGVLATGGDLVFQGTGRGKFFAYDATTGERLWTFDAGLGINAAPSTYLSDGVQYISLLVGYGGGANASKVFDYGWRFNEQPRRVLTFALGKKTPLPPTLPPRFTVRAVDDPKIVIDAEAAAEGRRAYWRCKECHGKDLENFASMAPDLRESLLAMQWGAFRAVVKEGAFTARGMPTFDDLSEKEVWSIYMYIRQTARETAQASVP